MVANKNFMPNDDQSEFEVGLRAPEGTSLEATEVLTNRVAGAIRKQLPEVDYTLNTIAGDPAHTRNLGTIYVRLTPIEAVRYYLAFKMADKGLVSAPNAAVGAPFQIGGQPPVGLYNIGDETGLGK